MAASNRPLAQEVAAVAGLSGSIGELDTDHADDWLVARREAELGHEIQVTPASKAVTVGT